MVWYITQLFNHDFFHFFPLRFIEILGVLNQYLAAFYVFRIILYIREIYVICKNDKRHETESYSTPCFMTLVPDTKEVWYSTSCIFYPHMNNIHQEFQWIFSKCHMHCLIQINCLMTSLSLITLYHMHFVYIRYITLHYIM